MSSSLEPDSNSTISAHERELLKRYAQETGHEINPDNIKLKNESSGGGGAEGDSYYEKSCATHGDTFMYKFKKRISRSPQQILR